MVRREGYGLADFQGDPAASLTACARVFERDSLGRTIELRLLEAVGFFPTFVEAPAALVAP